jgi:hypothetical protein
MLITTFELFLAANRSSYLTASALVVRKDPSSLLERVLLLAQ